MPKPWRANRPDVPSEQNWRGFSFISGIKKKNLTYEAERRLIRGHAKRTLLNMLCFENSGIVKIDHMIIKTSSELYCAKNAAQHLSSTVLHIIFFLQLLSAPSWCWIRQESLSLLSSLFSLSLSSSLSLFLCDSLNSSLSLLREGDDPLGRKEGSKEGYLTT